MPAAAVIPAPIAYIKVVAVKKLVVGFPAPAGWSAARFVLLVGCRMIILSEDHACSSLRCVLGLGTFTLKKLECSKQAIRLNTLAWNNGIGLWSYFVGFWDRSND